MWPNLLFAACLYLGTTALYWNYRCRNVPTLDKHLASLQEILEYRDGWDGDDAVAPSYRSVLQASEVVKWASKHDFEIDVDGDVEGGVAVYLELAKGYAWISCLNDGSIGLILSYGGSSRPHPFRLDQATANLIYKIDV